MVELPKTEEGLGFNVMGGKEQNSPIYISRIIPGGLFCDSDGVNDDGDDYVIEMLTTTMTITMIFPMIFPLMERMIIPMIPLMTAMVTVIVEMMATMILLTTIWCVLFFAGVADRHGGLKRGDQLLSVNGVSVEGEHHEKVSLRILLSLSPFLL